MQDATNQQHEEKKDAAKATTPAEDVENADEGAEEFPGKGEQQTAQVIQAEPEQESDRVRRLMADFDNFRKRANKEIGQARQKGRRDAVEKLLPVYDSLTMGLLSIKADDPVRGGMMGVVQQLLNSFEELGLQKLQTKGEPFNPTLHEAIANLPSNDLAEGLIIEESRSGFEDELGLLRPAQVVVSAGPGPQ